MSVFPLPSQDYFHGDHNIGRILVKDPAATHFMRVRGEAMEAAGVSDDDVLVVDRSLRPIHGDIVVAALEGEFIMKRLIVPRPGLVLLQSASPGVPAIPVTPDREFAIFGVAPVVLHQLGNRRTLSVPR